MEKLNRFLLGDIQELASLKTHWEEWGVEYDRRVSDGGRSSDFQWKSAYNSLMSQLELLSKNHCSFCDSYPLGKDSKQTIEHYLPKNEYPRKPYDWTNFYLSCDKCQNFSNPPFIDNLKPDYTQHYFDEIFYFEPISGEIKIQESLENMDRELFDIAQEFLQRYGINCDKNDKTTRRMARRMIFRNIKNSFLNKSAANRNRDDF